MQECTPEIITEAAKKANLDNHIMSCSEDPAFLLSNKETGNSFMASSWSLYPTQHNWHANIMRYKELTSRYLNHGDFKSIPGMYINTENMSSQELLDSLMEYVQEIGFPCVIKPNTGSGSKNINIIKDKEELTSSLPHIKGVIHDLLIQKHIKQDEYRVFIHKGEILYLYKKEFVLNDGVTDRLSESPCDKSHMMKSDFPAYLQDFAKKLYDYTDAEIIGADVFIKKEIAEEQDITIIELNHNPGLGVMYQTYNEKEFILQFLSSVYKNYLS